MTIPKNETGMTSYIFNGAECYKITRNAADKYILYKTIGNNNYQKMKTANSPIELETVIEKDRRN